MALLGEGTELSPWQIGTTADWQEFVDGIQATAALRNDYYIITQDIDFSAVSAVEPCAPHGSSFAGQFDGNDKVLSNITLDISAIDSYNSLALFQRCASGAVIKDLTVNNITVSGSSPNAGRQSYCAGLVGENSYGSTIQNCDVQATITHAHTNANSNGVQYALVGTIAGANHGLVEYCNASGSITCQIAAAASYVSVGGIIGLQTSGASGGQTGYVRDSISTTTITFLGSASQSNYVGGIAGRNVIVGGVVEGYIQRCHYNGTISFSNNGAGLWDFVGGGVADASANIEDSSARGTITAVSASTSLFRVGGFTSSCILATAPISGCYADVAISVNYATKSKVGGFIGWAQNTTITNCYAKGSLTDLKEGVGQPTNFENGSGFGQIFQATATNCWAATASWGIKGGNTTSYGFGSAGSATAMNDCFWDSTSSGISAANSGATAKTTAQLKKIYSDAESAYNETGYDFDLADGRVWKMADGMYPLLDWQTYPYGGGAGTAANPYKIKSLLDWNYAYTNVDNRSGDITTYFQLLRDSTLATEFMIIKRGGSSSGGVFGGGGGIFGN